MSVAPYLTVGPARNPYFTAQEVVYGNGTTTFSSASDTTTVITLTTTPYGGSSSLFSTTGTIYTCQQAGFYQFLILENWSQFTATTAYGGYVSCNAIITQPSGNTSLSSFSIVPILSTSQTQTSTFFWKMNVGDSITFQAVNVTFYSALLQVPYIKMYLLSAF